MCCIFNRNKQCLKRTLFNRTRQCSLVLGLSCIFNVTFQSVVGKKKNDVFISYHEGDENLMQQISSCLKSLDASLTVFSRQISYHKEDIWQKQIFTEITKSKR